MQISNIKSYFSPQITNKQSQITPKTTQAITTKHNLTNITKAILGTHKIWRLSKERVMT